MSNRDTMRDSRFSDILLAIECKLEEVDRFAQARGLNLTDSNIRSLLVRASNEAKSKKAKPMDDTASEKDRLLNDALQQLVAVRDAIVEEEELPDGTVQTRPLPTAVWIASLEAIKDSCAVRTGQEPGSRGYLEFLRGFIRDLGHTP
jgi:hypothetical protein